MRDGGAADLSSTDTHDDDARRIAAARIGAGDQEADHEQRGACAHHVQPHASRVTHGIPVIVATCSSRTAGAAVAVSHFLNWRQCGTTYPGRQSVLAVAARPASASLTVTFLLPSVRIC